MTGQEWAATSLLILLAMLWVILWCLESWRARRERSKY